MYFYPSEVMSVRIVKYRWGELTIIIREGGEKTWMPWEKPRQMTIPLRPCFLDSPEWSFVRGSHCTSDQLYKQICWPTWQVATNSVPALQPYYYATPRVHMSSTFYPHCLNVSHKATSHHHFHPTSAPVLCWVSVVLEHTGAADFNISQATAHVAHSLHTYFCCWWWWWWWSLV